MFDKTPAKYIIQKNLTGRFGVRKGMPAVETATGWLTVDRETVYMTVDEWSEWGDSEVPRPTGEWQTLTAPTRLIAYDRGERSVTKIPPGTQYRLHRGGCPASAAVIFLIRPDREYGPLAARVSRSKHGYNLTR